MALTGHLNISFPDGREQVRLRFEVSDEGEAVLRTYSSSVKELMASIRRVGGLPVQLSLSFRKDEELAFTTQEPTDDQRAVILYRLRPLILTNESASFDRVCGIVRRSSDHAFLGTHLRRLRDIYSGSDIRDMVVISRGDVVLNSDSAFQHWLNGFEYHREQQRAELIADNGALLPIEAIRPIFMAMLGEKVKAITLLAYVVDKMLERPASDAATA